MSTPVNTDFRGSGREVVAHEQQRTSRPLAPCGWAAAPVRALASRRGSQHLIRLHSRSAPHPEDRPSAVSGSRTGQGWRRSRVFRERRRRRTRCHSGLPGSPRAAGNRPPKTMPVLALFAGHSRVHDAETTADRARRLLPRARVQVLPGVGHHALPIAGAAAVDAIVLDFLGAPSAEGRPPRRMSTHACTSKPPSMRSPRPGRRRRSRRTGYRGV